jgi:hypothetical protein
MHSFRAECKSAVRTWDVVELLPQLVRRYIHAVQQRPSPCTVCWGWITGQSSSDAPKFGYPPNSSTLGLTKASIALANLALRIDFTLLLFTFNKSLPQA